MPDVETDTPTPTGMPAEINCPTCGKPVFTDPAARPASFPFCRPRCKLIDLGRWLSGEYRIAGSPRLSEPEQHDTSEDAGTED